MTNPPKSANNGSHDPRNNEIRGVRNSSDWMPNFDEAKTKAATPLPPNVTNQRGAPGSKQTKTKNILVAISLLKRGVNDSIRGPIAKRENHIGVKTYSKYPSIAFPSE